MIDQGRFNVLGIRINAINYEAAVERIIDAAHNRRPQSVSALAVHGVMTGVLDSEQRYRLNRLDILTPDGQPVRWALNWLYGLDLADRVYGPSLMLDVCRAAEAENLPIFLFGGTHDMLQQLEYSLKRQVPALKIAGRRASRFRRLTPVERDEMVVEIGESGAALTFVGLGCPRQEVWVYEFRDRLSMPLVAVGAAFAFHADRLPQAPPVLQARGLEWCYRLVQEPRRLWRRYLLLNPLYLTLLLLQRTGVCHFDPYRETPPADELWYG